MGSRSPPEILGHKATVSEINAEALDCLDLGCASGEGDACTADNDRSETVAMISPVRGGGRSQTKKHQKHRHESKEALKQSSTTQLKTTDTAHARQAKQTRFPKAAMVLGKKRNNCIPEGVRTVLAATLRSSDFDGPETSVGVSTPEDKDLEDWKSFIRPEGFEDKDSSRSAYGKALHQVLHEADVLLEVLDCRDPLGCRTWQVENFVNSQRPEVKIILVLNKIDLVPKTVVDKWVRHLQAELPVAVFKAATQTRRDKSIAQTKVKARDATGSQLHTSNSVGGSELIQMLKSLAKGDVGFGGKTRITVGIVGYPNVGKSSVANSLLRHKSAATGDRAGVTKHLQHLNLGSGISLIDSPGVVFDNESTEAQKVLQNCLPVDQVEDVIAPIAEVVRRCGKETLCQAYKLSDFRDHVHFLRTVAEQRGKFLRGGEPDMETAARMVLQDWNRGKFKYYTLPPCAVLESHIVGQPDQ